MAVRATDGTRSGGRGSATWLALTAGLLLTGLALMAVSPGTALAQTAPVYTQAALSGNYYGATSTTRNGGGAYEDVAMNTAPGQLVCASAWVRTQYPATGASGSFVVWLIGGGAGEGGRATYSGLGNLGNWSELQTCTEATVDHSAVRIQFYPSSGSPTVDMDDVDVHSSLAVDGGFEAGGGWAKYPGTNTNFSDYGPSSGALARSGSHFGATNTNSPGGGIYQDVAMKTSPGQVVCGSAWVRTEGAATGASGSFVLWLTGGTSDQGKAAYSGLGNGSDWTELHTCVEATRSHTGLRIQFYPSSGSPTVEIDDVDVHASLAPNGGFEYGSGPWGTYPNTNSSYDAYATNQVTGPSPPIVTTPVPTPVPVPRGRHALKVKLYLSWTWRDAITRLDRAKAGSLPGRARLAMQCRGRGCPRHSKMSATGARHVRRLLGRLRGRRYRAGDVLRVTVTAPGYGPERAQVTFRYGRVPLAKLVPR